MTVSPDIHYFYYQEYAANGRVLDTERGIIPGVRGDLGWSLENWTATLSGAYFRGMVDYHGQTQSGQPHNTTTEETFFHSGLTLSRPLSSSSSMHQHNSRLFIQHNYHWWGRDIRKKGNVVGLYEEYRWLESGLGMVQTLFHDSKQHWELGLGFFRVHNANMTVDINAIGKTRFELRSRNGFQTYLNWQQSFHTSYKIGMQAYYKTWKFGRSDSVNGFYEPESRTYNFGLQCSIIFPY